METNNNSSVHVASQNDNGTFSVGQHKALSETQLRKLQNLIRGKWLIFRDYSKPMIESSGSKTTVLNFNDAK